MLQIPKRLLSIDVFRAIIMFFMIFVNDLEGVRNVPGWIDHVKANEDGLHLADTIFPIFLFIAGLSIPLAIGKRLKRGESSTTITGHILLRSFALIVMGLFHVNMENYNPNAFLPLGVWELLLTLSFFLVWLDYPETFAKAKKFTLISIGVVILIVLAILYKGGTPAASRGLRTYWWGILGIIGWAYLVCAGVYLIAKGNLIVLGTALTAFVVLNICIHASVININPWVIKDGASASLTMFGVVISVVYLRLAAKGQFNMLWFIFTLSGVGLIALGLFIRPYTEGISKIHSTPSWVFICTGIGILIFELLIGLIDIKTRQNWFKVIKHAGTSTLTAYLLPYLLAAVFTITHFSYPYFFSYGAGGVIRSFAISFIIIIITGRLEKRRLRLKI
jgi:heparan-alpha-glucosaminide N-acetyltransferase